MVVPVLSEVKPQSQVLFVCWMLHDSLELQTSQADHLSASLVNAETL